MLGSSLRQLAYDEAYRTRVATLLDRVSEEQARDTVEQLEEFGSSPSGPGRGLKDP